MSVSDNRHRIAANYEVPGKIITLKTGEYLFHEGDHAEYFYFVRAGQIFIMKYAESGRVLSLRLATKGSIIGELPLYEENPAYIFNAVAQIPSEVYAIEFPTLHSYLEKKPALAISPLKIIGQHMRKQHSKFRDLLLYGKNSALTNQELANYSATARESLNRMLSELRRQNVIEMRGGLIFIKDINFLKAEIQCENCGKEICNIE